HPPFVPPPERPAFVPTPAAALLPTNSSSSPVVIPSRKGKEREIVKGLDTPPSSPEDFRHPTPRAVVTKRSPTVISPPRYPPRSGSTSVETLNSDSIASSAQASTSNARSDSSSNVPNKIQPRQRRGRRSPSPNPTQLAKKARTLEPQLSTASTSGILNVEPPLNVGPPLDVESPLNVEPSEVVSGYNPQIENGEVREWLETGQGEEELPNVDRKKMGEMLEHGVDGPFYTRLGNNGELQ
ncbi:hypothetical protein JCM5350_007029, partial [Sporobolomyces pararoseus]